jgi:hypothetical protein
MTRPTYEDLCEQTMLAIPSERRSPLPASLREASSVLLLDALSALLERAPRSSDASLVRKHARLMEVLLDRIGAGENICPSELTFESAPAPVGQVGASDLDLMNSRARAAMVDALHAQFERVRDPSGAAGLIVELRGGDVVAYQHALCPRWTDGDGWILVERTHLALAALIARQGDHRLTGFLAPILERGQPRTLRCIVAPFVAAAAETPPRRELAARRASADAVASIEMSAAALDGGKTASQEMERALRAVELVPHDGHSDAFRIGLALRLYDAYVRDVSPWGTPEQQLALAREVLRLSESVESAEPRRLLLRVHAEMVATTAMRS